MNRTEILDLLVKTARKLDEEGRFTEADEVTGMIREAMDNPSVGWWGNVKSNLGNIWGGAKKFDYNKVGQGLGGLAADTLTAVPVNIAGGGGAIGTQVKKFGKHSGLAQTLQAALFQHKEGKQGWKYLNDAIKLNQQTESGIYKWSPQDIEKLKKDFMNATNVKNAIRNPQEEKDWQEYQRLKRKFRGQ